MSEAGTQKSTNPKIDLEASPTFAKYILPSRTEILSNLKTLAEKARMMTVYQKTGQEFFLSTVLGVDPANSLVYIERAKYEPAWLKNLDDDFLCASDVDRVKIQFTLINPRRAELNGELAWVASLPKTMVRLQRREYFRLDIPMSKPVHCLIKGIGEGDAEKTEQTVQLNDISGGGIGFTAPENMVEAFSPGKEYEACVLTLPNEEPFTINLTIRSAYPVTTRSGIRSLRVGAEFLKINQARINIIQRYITAIERERRARMQGDF